MEAVLFTVGAAVIDSIAFLFSIVGPIIVYSAALYFLGRFNKQGLMATLGWRFSLVFALVGTPVHELSHVLGAWLGRHKVHKLTLFRPNLNTNTLGEVITSYDTSSFYQRNVGVLLVGYAPLVMGAIVMTLAAKMLAPDFSSLGLLRYVGSPLGEPFAWLGKATGLIGGEFLRLVVRAAWNSWQHWLFLFLTVSIGAHLVPSPEDLKGTLRPALVVLGTCVVIHLILRHYLHIIDPFTIILEYSVYFQRILVLALFLNAMAAAMVGLLYILWDLFKFNKS